MKVKLAVPESAGLWFSPAAVSGIGATNPMELAGLKASA